MEYIMKMVMPVENSQPVNKVEAKETSFSEVLFKEAETFFEVPLNDEKKVESPRFLDQLMSFVSQMAKNFFFAIDQMSA